MAIKKLAHKTEKALRRAGALPQTVIRMKQSGTSEEPGPLIAGIVYEKRGRKLVPRLHVRKQESQAVCTKRVHGVGQWFQCLLAKMRESQAAANQ